MGDLLTAAVANNAHWCDIVCRSHGLNQSFAADAWTSARRTPPLYPDAVTRQPGCDATKLLARVDASVGCSVKDSFGDLDLSTHGFAMLFEATWIALIESPLQSDPTLKHSNPDALGGCLAMARSLEPDLPLVGYERGASLAHALAHGFEPIGPLRVWIMKPTRADQ